MKRLVITIDGPAASGKGSLSKKISEEFNFFYMETGIYYRGFANLFYQNQLNILELSSFISNLNITFNAAEYDRPLCLHSITSYLGLSNV